MDMELTETPKIGRQESQSQEVKVWDEETLPVGERRYKFRHISGTAMKKLQRACRNPRTGDIDEVRYFQRLCDEIVVGQVNDKGDVIPGLRFDPSQEPEVICTEMENVLMSFLGYTQ